ncbi:MAG: zinc-binding dehydrogenase [Acidobacteria bacterium]|nr:zinc-binding dehydrogenase [Acidobacteriota bacterium]
MRAYRIHEHGGPEVLRLTELPLPEPGPGEVRIRLEAMALNHLDVWVRRGIPGVRFPLPLVPGCDGAGRIDALGDGVAGPLPGTRVFVLPGVSCMRCERCLAGDDNLCPSYAILGEGRNGTATEYLVLPATSVWPLADALDLESGAAFGLTFLTAWQMVVRKARVEPGMKVLVHAAASGVSVAAIQIARLFGARVVATAGAPEKRALALELGAEEAFDAKDPGWVKAVRAWAGPRGIQVVADHVGQETFPGSLQTLSKGGRYVFVGASSGFEMKTDFRPVFYKNLEILGSTMGRRADLATIAQLIGAGRLKVVVDSVFPFEEMAAAHRRLEERKALGKVVVRIR